MSYTVKVFLDKRQQKQDNSYPIKLRIRTYGKAVEIALKHTVLPKYWDEDKKVIKTICKTIPNVRRVNIRMQEQKTHALNILSDLEDKGELSLMSTKEIKAAITNTGRNSNIRNTPMILAFGEEIIQELKSAGKVGNARVYDTMLRSIRTYLNSKDQPLLKTTYRWLKKYEAWYLGRGNSVNGLGVHMRTLRALYNRAIKSKLVPRDSYPFDDYRIKSEKTKKRAVGETDILKLKEVVPQTSRQERAKDYFLMSFYLMGASFIDLAFLTKKSIQNGRIEYKRKKTGQLHDIKITAPLQALLDKYLDGKIGKSPYILNVVKGDTEEQRYTSARDELRRYNKALKELAEIAGIEGEITSYTARHSFATIAKFKGVPVAVISQGLGHEDTKTTEIYLSQFDNTTMDKYNDLIIGE